MSKKAIAVIGEGITEKHYIESLKGLSDFTVRPKALGIKASNLKKLKSSIDESIEQGYDEVYCLIDMDGKREGKTKSEYQALKQKYQKIHTIKKRGVSCHVVFIETERCTELWFLYHFMKNTTTQEFSSYACLEKALQEYLPNYSKTDKYFTNIRSLHRELTTNSGSLTQARKNATLSIASKEIDGRDYTYSEMHLLIEALGLE